MPTPSLRARLWTALLAASAASLAGAGHSGSNVLPMQFAGFGPPAIPAPPFMAGGPVWPGVRFGSLIGNQLRATNLRASQLARLLENSRTSVLKPVVAGVAANLLQKMRAKAEAKVEVSKAPSTRTTVVTREFSPLIAHSHAHALEPHVHLSPSDFSLETLIKSNVLHTHPLHTQTLHLAHAHTQPSFSLNIIEPQIVPQIVQPQIVQPQIVPHIVQPQIFRPHIVEPQIVRQPTVVKEIVHKPVIQEVVKPVIRRVIERPVIKRVIQEPVIHHQTTKNVVVHQATRQVPSQFTQQATRQVPSHFTHQVPHQQQRILSVKTG